MRSKKEIKSILTQAKAEIEEVLHNKGVIIVEREGEVFVQYETFDNKGKSFKRGLPITNTPF